MEEAILKFSIEILFKKLASPELWQFARQEKIQKDLNEWKKKLVKIEGGLEDAEEKQVREEAVKIWLEELRNLAYDVEDILDEFATEALRRKLLCEADQASTSRVRKLIPSSLSSLSPQTVRFNCRIVSQTKEITTRLQDIAAQKDQFCLKEYSAGRSHEVRKRLPTTSLVNEVKVYGREKEQDAIVELLLSDGLSTDDGISVIPIIGMGGIGKTTLAQLAYNDVRLEGRFDVKTWVSVSEEFDVLRITKTILHSVNAVVNIGDGNDLNLLQEQLKKVLSRKKFLFVFDDVWNENPNNWDALKRPFEAGSPGSKIIVTTRNEGVSTMIGTLPAYSLTGLSYEACSCIFTQYSLGRADFTMHRHLKEVGEKIVERCNGLPLAAATLGGLLHGKADRNDWEDVLNSKIWELPEEKSDLIPALKVSYHYLPSYLKRCFSYCSIFPKDYEFRKEEIILLWMAEGLLQQKNKQQQMEDLGNQFFHDLKSRSFFQQSGRDMSRFVMHDLINDLAQWAAGEMCFRMDNKLGSGIQVEVSKNLRYFSYILGEYDGVKKFEAISDSKLLRTFLPIWWSGIYEKQGSFLTGYLFDILPTLRYLRALSLRGYLIFELPNTIGKLKLLRYLDLSHTAIEVLPESISTLYNLETLLLENCSYLRKLCADMGNLINLHHLNNNGVHALEEMPRRIGNLTGLLTLTNFVVSNGSGSALGELKSLKHIRERLCISGLQNVDTVNAIKADLNGKRELKVLELKWTISNGDSRDAGKETRVLENLRPSQNLKELIISGYHGLRFPFWLGDSSFSDLVLLKLEDCSKCTVLPSVGRLPSLTHLVIRGMTGVKSVGSEFYSCSEPFPSLETLCFECMEEWEEWNPHGLDEEVFPHLQELSIIRCSKLVGRLPERLPSLKRLIIRSCDQLSVSVSSLPKLWKLEIEGCKQVVQRSPIELGSLNSVLLSDISSYICPAAWFTQGLGNVEELRIVGCKDLTSFWQSRIELQQENSSLRRLVFKRCPHLLCLVAEKEEQLQQQKFSCRLQCVELNECESFEKLPIAFRSLSFLTEISIKDCPRLVSLPETGMPPQLRIFKVEKCNALTSLPEAWMYSSSTYLESLSIKKCDSLTYIAKVQLPLNLKRLVIIHCCNLLTLVDEEGVPIMHNEIKIGRSSSLEYMRIMSCESLSSLWSKSELPATLEYIELSFCSNLASFSSGGDLPKALKTLKVFMCLGLERIAERLHDYACLETIEIFHCYSLKYLPEDMHKLRHLQRIAMDTCYRIEALPNRMHNLTSLRSLGLRDCPRLVSFPENGFPTSLTLLVIIELDFCKPLFDWGLHRLTSLRDLRLNSCSDLVSFPQEEIGMMLPSSLTSLELENFRNLKRLSSSIKNLTSLEELSLFRCYNLKSFPEGLPSSLLKLTIHDCPKLIRRCEKDKGDYWPKIARIPYICLDLDFLPAYGPPRSIKNSTNLWPGRQNLALYRTLEQEQEEGLLGLS